ncbi:RidA family protein [Propionibacteriaceae bacterium Y1700]|uniref:RidA family protein n=1 Tax=Microlunatus sp. Y1700 TaxID=3418487 RepID=UPI003DA72D79
MTVQQRLDELGLTLPAVAAPVAAYVPATTSGRRVLTAGQLPFVDGKLPLTGKVGAEVTLEQAAELARTCALNGLAAAASVAGGVDKLIKVVKVVVFVASAPDFTQQPVVANGASELLGEVFGEAGQHVRSAVGVAVLPLDAPVEVEFIFETEDEPRVVPARARA